MILPIERRRSARLAAAAADDLLTLPLRRALKAGLLLGVVAVLLAATMVPVGHALLIGVLLGALPPTVVAVGAFNRERVRSAPPVRGSGGGDDGVPR